MCRFIAINLTSSNIPESKIIPDRPLAYGFLPERAGKMEISIKLSSIQLTQDQEKFALNVLAPVWRFLAMKVTSPNTPVSQIIHDRPLAYGFLPERAGKIEISIKLSSIQLTQNREKFALNV